MKTQNKISRYVNFQYLVLYLCVFTLICIGCGGGGGGGDSASDEPGTTPAVALEYEVDATRTVSALMDNTGGSLLLLNAGPGIDVSIDVPAASLVEDSVIGMTPVTSIQSIPTGFNPLVAVRLEPEYQAFGAPVRITFNMPEGFREGKVAVGFFTEDDGSGLYLTPLLGPDGEPAGQDENTLTIIKSSFSTGGVTLVDWGFNLDLEQDFTVGGEYYENQIASVLLDIGYDYLNGLGDGSLTEQDLADITEILNAWNQELRERLEWILDNISVEGVTEANTYDLLGIIAEREELESFCFLDIDTSAIEDFLTRQNLEDSLQTFIIKTFELCVTTDKQKMENSEVLRTKLYAMLQWLNVNVDVADTGVLCLYSAELQPFSNYLDSTSDEAQVSLVLKSIDPVSGQADQVVSGATFSSPLSLDVTVESNHASLVDFNPDSSELRFRVHDIYVEMVRVSNEVRLVGSATATAQIGSIFSGIYDVDYSGSASGCTDPEDEGTESGQLQITAESNILSIENGVQTHLFTASADGAELTLEIVWMEGDEIAAVSGDATYTESETEVVFIGGKDVVCTYTTMSGGHLDGQAEISANSVSISITASDVDTSYSGSPAICGSGSCAVATGEATLTRNGEP